MIESNTTARSSIKVKKKSAFDVKKRKNQSCILTNYQTGVPLTEFLDQKDDFKYCQQSVQKMKKQIDFCNWKILKLIGQGAYAKVYLIQHKSISADGAPKLSQYAMKVYNKKQLIDSDLIDSTMQERQILLDMENPFILGLHYAFQTQKRLYFVTDFVSGGDLFQYIK